MQEIISQEVIENFLHGEDPEKYIVGVEYDYRSNRIFRIIQDPVQGKIIKPDTFTAFLWVGDLTGLDFYNNSKERQKKKMGEHGILIEPLKTYDEPRLQNGLRYMVKSLKGYSHLVDFFKQGGIDPWKDPYKKYFQLFSPVEQYLIQKRKRLFKGLELYDDVHRMVFDIETTGLDPQTDKIILIGVKTNRGFKKVISALGDDGEKHCIEEFFKVIKEHDPTIIGGYNSAFFDFPFIMERAKILNVDVSTITQIHNPRGIYAKEGILKLANEMEPYNQYVLWGFNIVDVSHSVRRAQAMNSDIKSWGLKYITKYLDKEKPNRVYVDGPMISKIYLDNENYYVNPKTGRYKKVGSTGTENLLSKYPGKYEVWSGKQIVEQYLDDDLYETMVVDESFSQSTFLLSKMVPTTYERISTMGTATLWKIIMSAWSYQYELAIPAKDEKRPITGGLSRLLKVGYAKNVVKFDYASLYPSIQLVYDVFPKCDVMGVMKSMLKYFRDIRIEYKTLAAQYKDTDPVKSEMFDRKQLPIKIFINAFFGSLSAPMVFPWGDMNMGETITCTGRQFLRMVIMFFSKKGYDPLVMDSVTGDTPIYIKDSMGNIDIVAISDIFDENSPIMSPDGLRDLSEKDYTVLTRSGWKNINYVYRHGTTKPIHTVVTKKHLVSCTSDHSLFKDGVQRPPSELKMGDHIDVYRLPLVDKTPKINNEQSMMFGYFVKNGNIVDGSIVVRGSSKTFMVNLHELYLTHYHSHGELIEDLDGRYKLIIDDKKLVSHYQHVCFNPNGDRKIPKSVLNGDEDTARHFFYGFSSTRAFSKVTLAGLTYLYEKMGLNYTINGCGEANFTVYDEVLNPNHIQLNMVEENRERYVYDISTEDGTFVGGIGGVILKNTDGVNFSSPEGVENRTYVGKGNNDLVEKGKLYRGIEADTAEFNDIFMRNEMGLDIDYIAPSCVNVSRKNYIIKILKKGKEKIKLTGNTIKSKKIPEYAVDFLDEGFHHLLNGDGKSFINLYYEHIERIFNQKVPLAKIANKARVKQSVNDYLKYIKKTTKAGTLMARQAHMELILENGYPAGLGETIYYVNNGKTKSAGDVQKTTKYKEKYTKKELVEYHEKHGKYPPKVTEVKINCYMITEKEMEENPEMVGEYNVSRYIANFNKRVQPLLVAFKPEIRDEILIEDPKGRKYFTDIQCELDNGTPIKEGSQDDINEVMTLSQSEVEFWHRVGRDPFYMYVDDSINIVDPKWVEHNRGVMESGTSTIPSNNEDEVIDTDGRDFANHTLYDMDE